MKIKKGDIVKVITGKDRWKTGKVIKFDSQKMRATVEGVNLYKKHIRPKKAGRKGEIITVWRPVAVSNLMIVCSNCQKASRVACSFEGGTKLRVCKKCRSSV